MTWISTQSYVRRQPIRAAWLVEFLRLGFIIGVLLYFLLPSVVLRILGWHYLGGGAEFEKIHIATYLIISMFGGALFVDTRFRNAVVALCYTELSLTAFAVSVGAVAMFAVAVKKVSIAPFVDTLLAAIVVTIGCICLPGRYLRALQNLINIFFIANIPMILYEYYTKSSIIGSATIYQDLFRPSALFEGPLSAAALLGLYSIVILISTPISFTARCITRLLLSVTSFAAMLPTGGRTALLAEIVIISGFLCVSTINQIRRGHINKAGAVYSVIAIPILITGLAVFIWLGLFDTITARFENDIGSALSRQLALDFMLNMSPGDLLFGLSAGGVVNLVSMQAEFGLIAIEISWVNFILVCGLVFTIPLFFTYILFLFRFLPRHCGYAVYVPSLFLLINTSASNGIWAKTTILTTSLAVIISFLKKDRSKTTPTEISYPAPSRLTSIRARRASQK